MQFASNPSGTLAYKEGNPTSRHQHERASQRRHTTRTRLPNRETNQPSDATRQRPNRQIRRNSPDPDHAQSYGTPISTPKNPSTIRILYQNIKGLSHNSSGEDHQYYLTHLRDLHVDFAGLSETNTAWQHQYLRHNFITRARKAGDGLAKTSFGSPSPEIDEIPSNDTFQAGGSITLCLGPWTTAVFGTDIQDKSGLGRWSGISIRGKNNNIFSLVTAYRTCAGSRQTASLGSTFHRETEFFINQARDAGNNSCPKHNHIPVRQQFLIDMAEQIRALQEEGHAVLLMLNANATITDDAKFQDMVEQCDLLDMHRADPATSTYIGASARRIDYIFGCNKVMAATTRQGTLAYHEGPQSDHRALYVDLDAYRLLAHHARDNAIQPPQARVLKTGNPEAVAIYTTKMKEYYDQHKMIKRIKKLHKRHYELSDDKVRVALEKWDRDQGRAMRHAEKALGSIRLKKHYWSPTLRNAGLLCRYWRLRLLSNRENRDVSVTIHRIQTMVQQHDSTYIFPLQHLELSTIVIAKFWKQAKQSLKNCNKKHAS